MPLGVFVPARLNDLGVDVNVGTPAHGALFYRGASVWNALAPGTSGQVLQTNGAGADPSWVTPASGVTDHGALTGLGDDDHAQYALLLGRAGGQTLIGGVNASDPLTLRSTSNITKGTILLDGTPTAPGAGTSSERFGSGATAAGSTSTAFGFQAAAGGNDTVAVGRLANAAGVQSMAIGSQAGATQNGSIALGRLASSTASSAIALGTSAEATASQAIAVGTGADATNGNAVALGILAVASGNASFAMGDRASAAAADAIAIGRLTSAGHQAAIAFGALATTTAANQLVMGGSTTPIDNVFCGKGVVDAAPTAATINGTGGSGTNIAGANLILAGGKGTGSALGGSIKFQSTIAGGSGTTLNTLQDKLVLTPAGMLEFWQRSSTADRLAFALTPTLPTATDASRTARAVFNLTDWAATREAMRLEANGSAAAIGVLGAAAAPRQTVTGSRGGNAALASLLTALATFGWITDSTSA